MVATDLISRMSSRATMISALKPSPDWRALINDGNCDLPREDNTCLYQLAAKTLLVYGFQEAQAGMAMYFDCQPDHPIGQWFGQKHDTFSVNTVLSLLSPC